MDITELAKAIGVKYIETEAAQFLLEKVDSIIEDQKEDRKEFAEAIRNLSDERLKEFIPDVYQKDIYSIDYALLKEKGIKLISYDIDDTITDSIVNKIKGKISKVTMPDKAKELFHKLKQMGFTVVLITNTFEKVASDVCSELQADGYVAKANKPETKSFEDTMKKYGITPDQMAHVGNSIRDDIPGGNRAGVTTCLVRRAGRLTFFGKVIAKHTLGRPTKGHIIREELLVRGMWRKHHLIHKGDQYYQLGEIPKYIVK